MRQQAVREDVRSTELKNSLGKEAKGCWGPSKKHPNGLQIGVQISSESKVALGHALGHQKDRFFLTGPPMEEAKDASKSFL